MQLKKILSLVFIFTPFFLLNICSAEASDCKLSTKRYVDPKGYFKIVPPAGWSTQEYPQDPRGKVAFIGTGNYELRVLTNSVDFKSFQELLDWCKTDGVAKIKSLGAQDIKIEKITFDGRSAVKRTFEFRGQKYLMVDFLVGSIDHNLQFSASSSQYNSALEVAKKSMDTYEPILKNISGKEANKHVVAKKYRLGQLMIQNENYDLALEFVKEGLEISPTDPKLLELKKELENKLE